MSQNINEYVFIAHFNVYVTFAFLGHRLVKIATAAAAATAC
jgi:hypothetical protein